MKQDFTQSAQAVEVVHYESGLTALQEKCAILLASGIRVTDAAAQVGASRASVYRWLDNAAFVCYLNQMKKEVQAYVEGALLDMHQKALDGIKASLESKREDLRLKASMWVVEKVSQLPIGETNVRKVIKDQVEEEIKREDNWETPGRSRRIDNIYNQRLIDAGLDG